MKSEGVSIVAVVVAIALAAQAGETGKESIRISMELADGSRLIGTTTATSFRLVSALGKIEIPLGQIRNIQFNQDRETAAVRLVNNDLLSGVLDLSVLPMQTLFGRVEVPLMQCRSIAFTGSRGDAGLVLHYTFDEDAEKIADRSGLGHDGYWVGAPVYETGVKGKAARFRSKDTYLVAPSPELNMNGWKEVTISIWFRLTEYTPYGNLISRGTLSTEKEGAFEFVVDPKAQHGGMFVGADANRASLGYSLPNNGKLSLNRWYHMAVTFDGVTVRFYVDGKQEQEARAKEGALPIWDCSGTTLVIGKAARLPYATWSDMFFDGLVDEVRIYKRALSEEEIKQIADLPK